MKCLILSVLLVELVLASGKMDLAELKGVWGKTCKNPKGKVRTSILSGCGQATCQKTNKGAKWDKCPMVATEESMNTQLAALKAGQSALEDGQRALVQLLNDKCGMLAKPTFKPTIPGHIECPAEWTSYHETCLRVFEKRLSGFEAETVCREESQLGLSGHLASIHSEEEDNFIADSFYEFGGWIGGHDLINEEEWQWSDESPFNYHNWQRGEPNNAENNEHCASWNRSGWNDAECLSKKKFLCKLS